MVVARSEIDDHVVECGWRFGGCRGRRPPGACGCAAFEVGTDSGFGGGAWSRGLIGDGVAVLRVGRVVVVLGAGEEVWEGVANAVDSSELFVCVEVFFGIACAAAVVTWLRGGRGCGDVGFYVGGAIGAEEGVETVGYAFDLLDLTALVDLAELDD